MTSGEWDLRALKALEAEEEKEFLHLSQTNILEPPPPPALPAAAHNLQHTHPHNALLLPTINECQAAASNTTKRSGTGPLKFSRALSLSAHSLVTVQQQNETKKKIKKFAHPLAAKSVGSLSPAQYSNSSLCTPPPIRRCATLHHSSTPLRKHYKQLQKQDAARKSEVTVATKSPQLQRICGTNKTFWKYGANSTAASIIGERRRAAQNTATNELESNTSDDLGSEEAAARHKTQCYNNVDYDDSATETGSCSVPLAADSNEMMRLMLSAATTAVSGAAVLQPPESNELSYLGATTTPPDIATATSGALPVSEKSPTAAAALKSYNSTATSAGRFFSLARYPMLKLSSVASCNVDEGETVAYEAFHMLNRRKSFSSAGTLLRANNSNTQESNRRVTALDSRKMLTLMGSNSAVNGNIDAGTSSFVEGLKTANHQLNHLTKSTKGVTLHPPHSHANAHPHSHSHHAAQHGAALLCAAAAAAADGSHDFDDELEHHIKHCSCSCNHMGYGNSMDYQTTGFGGLPDVTEHSNIRRTNNTLSRQNSLSNSESGGGGGVGVGVGGVSVGIGIGIGGAEIASIQKTKTTFADVKSAAATTTATMSTSATLQRSKKHGNSGTAAAAVEHYKSRRATCIFGLTLLVALALLAVAATLATQHFFMAPSRNSHAQRLRIVRRVLKEVPLVDGHNDFAGNVRKYAHSSLELVHLSHDLDHKSMWTRPTWAQTDMERLKQGLIGVQVWSAFVPCEAQGLDAVQLALEQIDIIRRFADMYSKDTLLVTSSKDIALARRRGLMASLIGIEGGHAIGSSLGVLRSFYSLGARYLSLTHKCDVSWAGSSSSPLENGLTQFGKSIIREMNRLGMMIDLSYSSDATARDVLEATRAPVIFSHSAARQLCNSTRNIPDDILRLVAENGGLIMVSFDPEDVACGRQAQLSDVVDHIKYIRSIAGIQHIGLGAGYDGIEQPPIGLEDVSKYPDLLATLLEDHNWSEEDVAMLAGKNFMRIMETVENVRDYWKRAAIQPIEQTEPQPKTQCTYMTS